MEVLNTIISILPIIFVLAIFIVAGILYLKGQKNKAQDWLIWAVSQAESYLGSGTGKLKLRYVYDLFIEKFPIFSTLVTFEVFSSWVDSAIQIMDSYIKTNPAIADVIVGDKE